MSMPTFYHQKHVYLVALMYVVCGDPRCVGDHDILLGPVGDGPRVRLD